MKIALCLLLFLACQSSMFGAAAAETAYTALRAFGKQNGPDALKRVVELHARNGTPDPEIWRITVTDGSARGGIREFEFRHGHSVSERAPVSRELPGPMNLTHLNLDSDGVFTIANQEAEKRSIPFDHIDYTLRMGGQGGAPVWRLDLFDGANGRVCSFDIAADSGDIVHRDFVRPAAAPDYSGDRAYVEPAPKDNGDEGVEEDDLKYFKVFLHKVRHHFVKRERQFQNFFSGRGWTQN